MLKSGFAADLVLVGLGGFIGSAARFALAGAVQRWIGSGGFPFGTLAVNTLGCLAIGLLGGLMEARQALPAAQRTFLLIGVLGGFTTYSTFAYETLGLAQASELLRAAANVIAHVLLGLGAAWVGYVAALQLGTSS